MALLEEPDHVAGDVKLPPAETVRGAARLRVVIVVIAFAQSGEADPEVVLAVIGRLKAPITECRHVADRVYRPRHIIEEEHRNVETPKQTSEAKGKVQNSREREMRNDVEIGTLPQVA